MSLFIKKHAWLVSLLLILGALWSVFFLQSATLLFMIATVFFFLVISILSILEKHKGTEDHHQKIIRDILVVIFTLILVILLGGFSGRWANDQVGGRFGIVMGFVCAVAASFAVGYLVRKGMGKLVR